MISLAPIRYARVLSKYNGPIERIEYGRMEGTKRPLYEAQAYLSKQLHLQKPKPNVFGAADGTGTHGSAMIARHMAVSEALERWALYYLNQSGMRRIYGFHIDNTSNGMAAFPGFFKRQARRRALLEAIERFSLVGWWNGNLGGSPFRIENEDLDGLQIDNPLSNDSVIVLWKRDPNGFYAYGYGAGKNQEQASGKAILELERTRKALHRFHRMNPGFEEDDLETLDHTLERRVVYFSLPAGYSHFRSRMETSVKPVKKRNLIPVIDCEIEGPWSRYATVWRVLFTMPTNEYLSSSYRNFFW